jgi:hypothetical protein
MYGVGAAVGKAFRLFIDTTFSEDEDLESTEWRWMGLKNFINIKCWKEGKNGALMKV